MSFDLVLDHITSIKKDVNYIRTVLDDHLPERSNSGRAWVTLPSFVLEQNERDQIIEISESIVTRVSEIVSELKDESWERYTKNPHQSSQKLYSLALQLNNDQYPDDASLFQPSWDFLNSINVLETTIKVTNAMNKGTSQKKYSENQLNASINELEKKKRETRLKAYNKLDNGLKKLQGNIESQNSNVLDKTTDKLLYVLGFDTEIYDPEIAGNIDVIALDTIHEIVCICENTTGKLSKKKVDQIAGRKSEYEKEYNSWKNVKVYPILICTAEDIFADDLAKRECALNGISVLNKKDLEDLIKNVKKGKMSPTLFVEYVKKRIPKSKV